jgi:hypothetical protein
MDKETLVTVQNKRKKWKKYIYCKSPQNKELYPFRFTCKNTLEKRIQKFGLTFVFSMYLSIVIYDAMNAFSLIWVFGFLAYFLLMSMKYLKK